MNFKKNPHMVLDAKNRPLCDACYICEEICPTEAININGIRHASLNTFKLDFDKCIFCGECETMCPHNALVWSSNNLEKSKKDGEGESKVNVYYFKNKTIKESPKKVEKLNHI